MKKKCIFLFRPCDHNGYNGLPNLTSGGVVCRFLFFTGAPERIGIFCQKSNKNMFKFSVFVLLHFSNPPPCPEAECIFFLSCTLGSSWDFFFLEEAWCQPFIAREVPCRLTRKRPHNAEEFRNQFPPKQGEGTWILDGIRRAVEMLKILWAIQKNAERRRVGEREDTCDHGYCYT